MVEDRVTAGRRIASLLAAELDGREDGSLAAVAVADEVESVEPTAAGALAYRVRAHGEPLARAYVHPDRVHLAFERRAAEAAAAADEADLRVRPKATSPPETLVFVESGAAVKDAANVVAAAAR